MGGVRWGWGNTGDGGSSGMGVRRDGGALRIEDCRDGRHTGDVGSSGMGAHRGRGVHWGWGVRWG